MLLCVLFASGADNNLTQLSVSLSNVNLHAKSLPRAATHHTQLASARGTHCASALAVALCKPYARHARRTRDIDKARAHIAVLRSEVDEAWKLPRNRWPMSINSRAAAITVAAGLVQC
jgi:hypothetical protein